MPTVSDLAADLGLVDVFALRRVSDQQLVNLAGAGRGEGWAGNISIDAEREPLIAEALSRPEVVRHEGEPTRIFGPYWTDAAAIVSMGDFVFVMGGGDVANTHDDQLIEVAGEFAWSVGDVPAEKQLADELEVTQAALDIASLPTAKLDDFLADLADTAAGALACEFGAVVTLGPTPRLVIAPSGWQPDATYEEVLNALLKLLGDLSFEEPSVSQDLRDDPHAESPLGFGDGLVSRCVIPLTAGGSRAALIVAHADVTPRGFTSLCQLVASTIGSQASRVLTNLVDDRPSEPVASL